MPPLPPGLAGCPPPCLDTEAQRPLYLHHRDPSHFLLLRPLVSTEETDLLLPGHADGHDHADWELQLLQHSLHRTMRLPGGRLMVNR